MAKELPNHKLMGKTARSERTSIEGKVVRVIEHEPQVLIEYEDAAGNTAQVWLEESDAKVV